MSGLLVSEIPDFCFRNTSWVIYICGPSPNCLIPIFYFSLCKIAYVLDISRLSKNDFYWMTVSECQMLDSLPHYQYKFLLSIKPSYSWIFRNRMWFVCSHMRRRDEIGILLYLISLWIKQEVYSWSVLLLIFCWLLKPISKLFIVTDLLRHFSLYDTNWRHVLE